MNHLQGGTGKYGLESDMRLLDSANLLMMISGEHLGTGATAPVASMRTSAKTGHELPSRVGRDRRRRARGHTCKEGKGFVHKSDVSLFYYSFS